MRKCARRRVRSPMRSGDVQGTCAGGAERALFVFALFLPTLPPLGRRVWSTLVGPVCLSLFSRALVCALRQESRLLPVQYNGFLVACGFGAH